MNTSGNIISDMHGTIAIGTRGDGAVHEFIKVGDTVFDNMNPQGISYDKFMNDLGLDSAPPSVYNINTKTW
ncbi:papain fold toxin domain-containing protein [Hafnia paralvei]|uniref:papain fold toxin domain-containing protein n=1 Tax=Hafnia paralvei TaxID=546367 RepID=UPI00187D622E